MYSIYIDNCIKYRILSLDDAYKALVRSKLLVRVYRFDNFRHIEFEVQSFLTYIFNFLYTINKYIRGCNYGR